MKIPKYVYELVELGRFVPLLWMSRPIRVLQARVNMDICSESIGRVTVNPAECLFPRWNV